MRVAGVCRQTVFVYRDKVVAGGVAALLRRGRAAGPRPAVRGAVQAEFIEKLEAGQFRPRGRRAAWIKKRTRRTLTESGVRKVLRRLGGKLKVPRKNHAKKDPAKAAAFKPSCRRSWRRSPAPPPARASPCASGCSTSTATVCCRSSAGSGAGAACASTRPTPPKYEWGYLHEALEVDGPPRPKPDGLELFFSPGIDQATHACFLRQIGATDPAALHVISQDQAGFHLRAGDPRLPATCGSCRCRPTAPSSPRRAARRPGEGPGVQPPVSAPAQAGGPHPRRPAPLALRPCPHRPAPGRRLAHLRPKLWRASLSLFILKSAVGVQVHAEAGLICGGMGGGFSLRRSCGEPLGDAGVAGF